MNSVYSSLLGGAIVALCPVLLFAQEAVPQTRIKQQINEANLKILTGNTHRLAQARFDQGAAPADLPMERMMLTLTRTPEQQAALDGLLNELNAPASPRFHQWLTPEQFGEQFGASDQDIQTVTNWLAAHGFDVALVAKGRTMLEFSGTAGQVAEAFHTQIHQYVIDGESHWANSSDPEIPMALSPVVAGVATLHNFVKKPQVHELPPMTSWSASRTNPEFTSSSGAHALTPGDYATIYNINPLYQAGINGSGASIAVVARTNINLSDINNFRSLFGLSTNPPQIVLNGINPGDRGGNEETEAVLDASWAGATAPGATVKFVVSKSTNASDGVDLSEAYIINNNLADVMTESFGSCETNFTTAQATSIASLTAQAAAQGITYMVSTGDSGASGCDSGSATVATRPVSINMLASSPYVVAVGGTQFVDAAGAYWNSTNSSTRSSALSYIPENVWNESCSLAQCGTSGAALWAGGGGSSIFFTKPSWQTGVVGIPADGMRDIPDVSLTAAGHDPYLLCLRGSCSSSSGTSFAGVGGTSASAPSFAGIMALVVQKTGKRQGQANVNLYRLAANQAAGLCNGSSGAVLTDSCIFNDITAGNNAVPGQLNYGTSNAQYQATIGYDLATGLGSVNVTNLVNGWTGASVTPGIPGSSLSATSVAFGNDALGMVATRSLTLLNNGTATLAISGITISSNGAGAFNQTNTCSSSLLAGASCSITVTFTPLTASAFIASLSVVSNASGSPQTVSLTGSGVGTLSISVSPSALAFGLQKLQTRSQVQTIQIGNSTAQTVSLSSVTLTGGATDFSVVNSCPSALAAGASCSIYVVFTPQLASVRSASLVVTSNAAASPQIVLLSGSGYLTGAFEIVNSVSGKVLDVSSVAAGNGALIQQSLLNGQTQQQWFVYSAGNGYAYILNAQTGKVLDDTGGSTSDGTLIQQYDYFAFPNQQWSLLAVDDVHYRIVNRASGKVWMFPLAPLPRELPFSNGPRTIQRSSRGRLCPWVLTI